MGGLLATGSGKWQARICKTLSWHDNHRFLASQGGTVRCNFEEMYFQTRMCVLHVLPWFFCVMYILLSFTLVYIPAAWLLAYFISVSGITDRKHVL
jgi:hypothetical protein